MTAPSQYAELVERLQKRARRNAMVLQVVTPEQTDEWEAAAAITDLESWKAEAERNGSIAERMIDAANERCGRMEARVAELERLLERTQDCLNGLTLYCEHEEWIGLAVHLNREITAALPAAKGE